MFTLEEAIEITKHEAYLKACQVDDALFEESGYTPWGLGAELYRIRMLYVTRDLYFTTEGQRKLDAMNRGLI